MCILLRNLLSTYYPTSLALGAENNELIDLAATLAEPSPAELPYPRSDVLDTIGKLTPWRELDEIPSGMQQHLCVESFNYSGVLSMLTQRPDSTSFSPEDGRYVITGYCRTSGSPVSFL